jgi:predicted transcriptional regulator
MRRMDTPIPTGEDVRERLAPFTIKQLEGIAEASGVPFTTLYKIQRGETANPGIETVGRFWAHLPAADKAAA